MLGMIPTRDIQSLSAPPLQFGFYLDSTRIDFVRTTHDKNWNWDSIRIDQSTYGVRFNKNPIAHTHTYHTLCLLVGAQTVSMLMQTVFMNGCQYAW